MNLLSYTKKLSEKIRFYDNVAQKSLDHHMTNPFQNPFLSPINLTIIWVEENCNSED